MMRTTKLVACVATEYTETLDYLLTLSVFRWRNLCALLRL